MSNNEMVKWNLGCIKTMFIHESLFSALNHMSSKSRPSWSKSRHSWSKSRHCVLNRTILALYCMISVSCTIWDEKAFCLRFSTNQLLHVDRINIGTNWILRFQSGRNNGLNCTSPSSITIINVLSINVVIKNCPASLRLFLNKGRTYEHFFYCTQEARKSLWTENYLTFFPVILILNKQL